MEDKQYELQYIFQSQDALFEAQYDLDKQKHYCKGDYGNIYYIQRIPDETPFLIEIIDRDKFERIIEMKEEFFNDLFLTKKINNQHVIQIHELIYDEKELYIITEFCNMSKLETYLQIRNKRQFQEKELKGMIFQLIEGLSQIHSQNIGHRDLNLQNIYVDQNILQIRNLAFFKYSNKDLDNFSPFFLEFSNYYPLELLRIYNVEQDIYKFDIFSLGVVIFFISEFRSPFIFEYKSNVRQKIQIIKKGPNFNNLIAREQPYSKDFYDLIQNMLKFDPQQRYSLKQILNHPFLQDDDNKIKPQIDLDIQSKQIEIYQIKLDIDITNDYNDYLRQKIHYLILDCGINDIQCLASGICNYWHKIIKIEKYQNYPLIYFQIYNGEEIYFGYYGTYYEAGYYYQGSGYGDALQHDDQFKCQECWKTHKKLFDELNQYLK